MDVVYILGSESPVQNEELRHSVRSIDMFMVDIRDIYIIGEKVDFLPGAKHIPFPDEYPEKWKNAYAKVLRACNEPDISEDFLLMNDDFYMQEHFTGTDFPYYALANSNGGSCGPHFYGMHCPMRITKSLYKKMPFSLDQKACMSPRSFYGNFYGLPPTFSKDWTVNLYPQLGTFDEQAAGKPFFTISNTTALEPKFMAWLGSIYSQPSSFELQGELDLKNTH